MADAKNENAPQTLSEEQAEQVTGGNWWTRQADSEHKATVDNPFWIIARSEAGPNLTDTADKTITVKPGKSDASRQ